MRARIFFLTNRRSSLQTQTFRISHYFIFSHYMICESSHYKFVSINMKERDIPPFSIYMLQLEIWNWKTKHQRKCKLVLEWKDYILEPLEALLERPKLHSKHQFVSLPNQPVLGGKWALISTIQSTFLLACMRQGDTRFWASLSQYIKIARRNPWSGQSGLVLSIHTSLARLRWRLAWTMLRVLLACLLLDCLKLGCSPSRFAQFPQNWWKSATFRPKRPALKCESLLFLLYAVLYFW